MNIVDDNVVFYSSDAEFVKKFGLFEAAKMVLDYKSQNKLPFIYDTYQLAVFLGIKRKEIFEISKNINKYYCPFEIKKKNGKLRQLYAPIGKLKSCQTIINRRILEKLPVAKYATAYQKGSKISKNAAPHIGKRYLLKLDITDFFNSISFEQVYSAAFNTRYFPKQIGVLLTELCCRNDSLVQGAPTSPTLSNIVMRNFDNNIGQWCQNRNIAYTRYCDDMTFSSDTPLCPVFKRVTDMLESMGFELNEKKTKFINSNKRQSVTGLTVNKKLSVSADYKRKLRQEVYYALKYGLADSIQHSGNYRLLMNGIPNTKHYFNQLRGKIAFVLQIEPDNKWFYEAKNKLDNL